MYITVCENVSFYHTVEVDDSLDPEKLETQFQAVKNEHDNGCEAIDSVLKLYQDKYGFDYKITVDGHNVESITVENVY